MGKRLPPNQRPEKQQKKLKQLPTVKEAHRKEMQDNLEAILPTYLLLGGAGLAGAVTLAYICQRGQFLLVGPRERKNLGRVAAPQEPDDPGQIGTPPEMIQNTLLTEIETTRRAHATYEFEMGQWQG
jgi:hypothetical protein